MSPFWTKKHPLHPAAAGRVKLEKEIWSHILNQPTLSLNPFPAGPEITIRADPVRLILGFLEVPFGTLSSHRFRDAFFQILF